MVKLNLVLAAVAIGIMATLTAGSMAADLLAALGIILLDLVLAAVAISIPATLTFGNMAADLLAALGIIFYVLRAFWINLRPSAALLALNRPR
jgi:hypothetical protein